MWRSFSTSPSIRRLTGTPVQAATTSAMSSSSTSSLSIRLLLLPLGELVVGLRERPLELGDRAELQARRALEVGLALGALQLHAGLLDLALHLADALDDLLLLIPVGAHRRRLLAQLRELGLHRLAARHGPGVGLGLQRLLLDLELHDAALDLVELLRHRVDLDAQAAGRLVHQVDGLVGQEARGDVAVRQPRGRHQRRVLDAHAVVDLVALLQPAQDRDGVLDRRLADEHRLEAPLERRVLLDVLAVLVERRGAHRPQLAAGQHRLEQVGRVHGALGGAGADDRVQLVDEEDDLALRRPRSP